MPSHWRPRGSGAPSCARSDTLTRCAALSRWRDLRGFTVDDHHEPSAPLLESGPFLGVVAIAIVHARRGRTAFDVVQHLRDVIAWDARLWHARRCRATQIMRL